MQKTHHIRPKIRNRRIIRSSNDEKSPLNNEDVDNLLEKTRQKMAENLNVSSVKEVKVHKASSFPGIKGSSGYGSNLAAKNDVGGERKEESGAPNSLSKQTKGILKQRLRYSRSENKNINLEEQRLDSCDVKSPYSKGEDDVLRQKLERATLAEEMGMSSYKNPSIQTSEGAVVNDFVIERSYPKADHYPENKAQGLEDNTYVNADYNDVAATSKICHEKDANCKFDIEADVEFSYMTSEEYKEASKVAKSMGVSLDDMLKKEKEINGTDEEIVEDETNGFDIRGDFDDEDNFLNFFDEEQEEQIIPPSLSPFMLLWNILTEWITSEGVKNLQEWRRELFSEEYVGPVVKETLENKTCSIPKPISNDVCLSRRSGLMAMLKLNMSVALVELGYNDQDGYIRKTAEKRLCDFIKTFNFSHSMVKLDSQMWATLTIVLLGIVLPKNDIQGAVRTKDNMKSICNSLPSQLKKAGLTIDEYNYLTCTAIPSMYSGCEKDT